MQKWQRVGFIAILTVVLLIALNSEIKWLSGGYEKKESAIAQSESSSTQANHFPVVLGEQTLFTIKTDIPEMYASQRATIATQEIRRIARNYEISVETIILRENQDVYIISQRRENDELRFIVVVNNKDAVIAQRPLPELANDWLKAIKQGIVEYREQHSLKRRILAVTGTIIATIALIILLRVTQRFFNTVQRYLDNWRDREVNPFQFRGLEIITINEEMLLAQYVKSLLNWALFGFYVFVYFLLITFFFPKTEEFGKKLFNLFQSRITPIWEGLINFLPNLLVIALVILIARLFLKTNKLIFDSLATGRVRWPGFYQDWARPTQQLISFLIWLGSIAIILPYLPIFQSPAIQGLGILGGALLTLGGASTVSSLISGYVIIYSRPFQTGDLIGFDEYQGFVYNKSVLATQIRTFNNEILTIPNATLQSKTIVNYSAIIRDFNLCLTLETTLTLGYDLPWRQIHEVLVEAAKATPAVLADPAPFVLQTSLDDFYVSYQLRVFINQPEDILQIYSNLLQNVQDYCNAASLEIMSPHYTAVRDGNQNTIPRNYLPKDYIRPGFKVEFPDSPGSRSPPTS